MMAGVVRIQGVYLGPSVQTLVRLPADLKARLVREAAKNNRTMSAEIIYRLRVAYGLVEVV